MVNDDKVSQTALWKTTFMNNNLINALPCARSGSGQRKEQVNRDMKHLIYRFG